MRFYAKIIQFLTKLFKENKQEKQNKLFIFDDVARQTFRRFIKTFTKVFILIYFNFKNFIKVKIDALNFIIIIILF